MLVPVVHLLRIFIVLFVFNELIVLLLLVQSLML